jgi:hypothetical protein
VILPAPLPPGGERPLTEGECALAQTVFRQSINLAPVRVRRRRFFPFQPRGTVMAPMGHLHFHPASPHYRDDFAQGSLGLQGLFIHELVHVWQTQQHGRFYLPLMRHPLCRYDYTLRPGWALARYGIEQQAEIVRHAFQLRNGGSIEGKPGLAVYEDLLPFPKGANR